MAIYNNIDSLRIGGNTYNLKDTIMGLSSHVFGGGHGGGNTTIEGKSLISGTDLTSNYVSLMSFLSSSNTIGLEDYYDKGGSIYPVMLDEENKAFVQVPQGTISDIMGTSKKGDTNQPVYWTGFSWQNTTYALNATVPSTAKFTDTTYGAATTTTLGLVKIFGSTTSAISSGAGRNYGVFLDSNNKAYVNVPWTDTITSYEEGSKSELTNATSASNTSKLWSAHVLNDWMGDILGVDLEKTTANMTALEKLFEDGNVSTGIISELNKKLENAATTSALGGLKVFGTTTSAIVDGTNKNYGVKLDKDSKAYVNVPWNNTTYSASTGLSLSGTAFSLKVATGDANGDEIGGVKLGRYNHSGGPIDGYSFIPYYVGSTEGGAVDPENHYGKFSLQMFGSDDTWANIAYIGIPTASKYRPGLMHQKYVEDLKLVRNMFTNIAGDTTINSTNGATTGKNYGVQVDNTGKAFVNVPWTNDNTTYGASTGLSLSGTAFSLKTATTGEIGGVIASNVLSSAVTLTSSNSSVSGRYYGVQVDNTGKAFVNVPWTANTDTTYSPSTGLGLSGTDFYLNVADTVEIGGICVTNAVSTRNNINSTNGNTSGRNYGVQINGDDEAFVNVPWSDTTYSASTGLSLSGTAFSLNKATASSLGGIKLGYQESGQNYKVQVDNNGNAFVNVPWTDTNTTYGVFGVSNGLVPACTGRKSWDVLGPDGWMNVPFANSTYPGGIKIGFTQNGQNYPVELDESTGKAYVNVPWTDTNTTYTLGGLMGTSKKGDTNQPIYWNGTAFVNTTYALNATVPSNAKFTDTTYTLSATVDGNTLVITI